MNIGELLTLVRNFDLTIDTSTLTANRTVLFQNRSGTIALTSDIQTSNLAKPIITIAANTTLSTAYEWSFITCQNTGSIVITIPNDSAANLDIAKAEIDILWENTGSVSITRQSGVTLIGEGGNITTANLLARYASVSIKKIGSNFWYIAGGYSY